MTKKLTCVTSPFKIIDGKFDYKVSDLRERLEKMKGLHEGSYGEVVYNIIDRIQYFQHKYYRGYVLRPVAVGQGEKDLNLVHLNLKKKFLFFPAGSLAEVPAKYRDSAAYVFEGQGRNDVLKGYIPSTSVLSYSDMRSFILKAEAVRDGLIGWSIPKEALRYRQIAFGEDMDARSTGDNFYE